MDLVACVPIYSHFMIFFFIFLTNSVCFRGFFKSSAVLVILVHKPCVFLVHKPCFSTVAEKFPKKNFGTVIREYPFP